MPRDFGKSDSLRKPNMVSKQIGHKGEKIIALEDGEKNRIPPREY